MQDIIYRLTIYDDSNTALTPVSGSSGSPVHNDPFVVTTYPVSGAKPYITDVRPGGGRAVIPDTKWQIGKYYLELADIRTSSTNLERWLTAFIGDGEGRYGLLGKKAAVEESLNGGSSWTTQFVGRVVGFTNVSPLRYTVELSDESDRLKRTVFDKIDFDAATDKSTISRKMILPNAFEQKDNLPYAASSVKTLEAKLEVTPYNIISNALGDGVIRLVRNFSNDSQYSLKWHTVFTDTMQTYLRNNLTRNSSNFPSLTYFSLNNPYAICRIFNSSDVFIGDYAIYDYSTFTEQSDAGEFTFLNSVSITQINGLFADAKISDIPTSANIKIQIFAPNTEDSIADYPMLVFPSSSTGTVLDVLRDSLDGYYDRLYNTGSYIPVTYDESNISAIEDIRNPLQSGSFTKFSVTEKYFLVDESMQLNEFIEENIMKPNALGYYLQPAVVSGVPTSQFKLFTLDRPTSTPATTIEDQHIISSEYIDWKVETPYKINRTFNYIQLSQLTAENQELYREFDSKKVVIDSAALVNSSFIEFNIDPKATSLLWPIQSIFDTGSTPIEQFKVTENIPNELTNRFLKGTPMLKLNVVRGEYESLEIGDWVLVDIQWQPNIGTLKRGGNRLMQIVSKIANKARLELELIDSGLNEAHAPPTISSVNIVNGVDANVTVAYTGSLGTIGVEYAIANSNSQPNEYDNVWTHMARVDLGSDISNTSVTLPISNIPSNKYLFVRARTEGGKEFKLPSAYVYSAGNASNTLSAPAGLSLVTASYYTAEVSWTASPSYSAEIYSTGNEAGSLTLYTVVPPNTNNITIPGFNLAPTSGQQVGVAYIDNRGGRSTTTTLSFTRGGATNQAPDLAGIFIFTDSFL